MAQTMPAPAAVRPLREMSYSEDEPVVVSICTCTYQNGAFLEQAIEGFLDQEAPFRIEIVIYDDYSTDGSRDVIAAYVDRYPTIFRAVMPDRNHFKLGISPYLAFVLPQARGRYIALCDADDYWRDPHKLALQAACLDAEPDVALTYGPALSVVGTRETDTGAYGETRDFAPLELKTGVNLNTLTACFRNPFLDLPPEFLRHAIAQDLSLWSLLGGMGSGRFLPELKPAYYRSHEGGIFSQQPYGRRYYIGLTSYACLAGYQEHIGDEEAEKRILFKLLKMIVSRIGRGRTLRWLVDDRIARLARRRSTTARP